MGCMGEVDLMDKYKMDHQVMDFKMANLLFLE